MNAPLNPPARNPQSSKQQNGPRSARRRQAIDWFVVVVFAITAPRSRNTLMHTHLKAEQPGLEEQPGHETSASLRMKTG